LGRLVGLLLVLLSACTSPKMLLNPDLNPQSFGQPARTNPIPGFPQARYLDLSPTHDSSEEWVMLWRQELGDRLARQYWIGQPNEEDYWLVDQLFQSNLSAFYLWIPSSIETSQLSKALCPAVSANELLWLSQRGQEEINQLRLDLLLTTYAEQVIRLGASPVYRSFNLQVLRTPKSQKKQMHLRGLVFSGTTEMTLGQGFWICRQHEAIP